MSTPERRTTCMHEVVTTSGIMAGSGGQVHEVGLCDGCGEMVRRSSSVGPWSVVEDGN